MAPSAAEQTKRSIQLKLRIGQKLLKTDDVNLAGSVWHLAGQASKFGETNQNADEICLGQGFIDRRQSYRLVRLACTRYTICALLGALI